MRWMTSFFLVPLLAGSLSLSALADERPAPEGPVMLTLAGKLAHSNRGPSDSFVDGFFGYHEIAFDRAFAFDRAALEALPQTSFTARHGNWSAAYEVEGPLLRDVLAAAGAEGEVARVVALDGYAAEIPLADAQRYSVILALKRDGQPLGIGDRGPVWLLYPRDGHPEITDEDEAKWVWSAFFIEVQ